MERVLGSIVMETEQHALAPARSSTPKSPGVASLPIRTRITPRTTRVTWSIE
jgi:hypothetical protein